MIADDLSHDSRDVHVYVWAQMRLLNIYLLAHLWASLIGHTPDRCSIIQVQPEKKSPTPPLLDRYPSAIHYRTLKGWSLVAGWCTHKAVDTASVHRAIVLV